MKKTILRRCLLGAPIGVAISMIVTIIISFAVGDGRYYATVPELVADCGGELRAVALQTACSMLYGAVWAGASAIWDAEGWSLLKMTLIHLAVCSAATFPFAYCMRWMAHSLPGILRYFGTFLAIYVAIWLSQYASMRRKIEAINRRVGARDRD